MLGGSALRSDLRKCGAMNSQTEIALKELSNQTAKRASRAQSQLSNLAVANLLYMPEKKQENSVLSDNPEYPVFV